MIVRLVGSACASSEKRQHLTTLVINDEVAIDAGALGLISPLASQSAVRHVLLSHSHIDHVATLPIFLDNVFRPGGACPTVYASRMVWNALESDVFNERLWPNLERIAKADSRFYEPVVMESEKPLMVAGLRITPVMVNHAVLTMGFLIEDERSAIVVASDTSPTGRIWELASAAPFRRKLRAVMLECSFPDSLAALAEKSGHHCPATFAQEIGKLDPDPPFHIIAVHLKAGMHDAIVKELRRLPIARLQIGIEQGEWAFE